MKKKSGFTLIELLVVIGIIVLLAGIVMPNFMKYMDKAKIVRARADIHSIENALAMYQTDWGVYPGQWTGADCLQGDIDNIINLNRILQAEGTEGRELYITKDIPPDPYGENYRYRAPGGTPPSSYHNPLRDRSYDLWSYGKNKNHGGDDDIACWDTETS